MPSGRQASVEGGGSVKISFGPLVRSEKAEDEGAARSFLLRIDLPASRPLVWTALLLCGLVEADGSVGKGGFVSRRLENNQGQGALFGLWLICGLERRGTMGYARAVVGEKRSENDQGARLAAVERRKKRWGAAVFVF